MFELLDTQLLLLQVRKCRNDPRIYIAHIGSVGVITSQFAYSGTLGSIEYTKTHFCVDVYVDVSLGIDQFIVKFSRHP